MIYWVANRPRLFFAESEPPLRVKEENGHEMVGETSSTSGFCPKMDSALLTKAAAAHTASPPGAPWNGTPQTRLLGPPLELADRIVTDHHTPML